MLETPGTRASLRFRFSVPLILFVVGAACFGLLFFVRTVDRMLILSGGLAWCAAYFWVISSNYRNNAPVWTRGGWLDHQARPRAYNVAYLVMAAIGALFIFVLLALNVFGH